MKVALVYDRINKWGGAERVLLALHALFPDAPLYTSVYDKKRAAWADSFTVKPSFLQKIPGLTTRHEFIPFLMPMAFEQFSFDKYDLVISVTSEAAKGIITKPTTKHICYCLTPTRYLWSGYDQYFTNSAFKAIAQPAVSYLRNWDQVAAQRADTFVSISKEVQGRVKKYYGKESTVIYPPMTIQGLGARGKVLGKKNDSIPYNLDPRPYFLVVSRFVPYKRIDLAIEACNELKLSLKIIGSGRDEKRLKALAGPTIEFIGKVTDEALANYYTNCKALIFPGIEDFGLAIIEVQQFGKPVIAFRGGGAVETILEGKTGKFFAKQTKESLIHALQKFDALVYDKKAANTHLERFSFARFTSDFMSLVQKTI